MTGHRRIRTLGIISAVLVVCGAALIGWTVSVLLHDPPFDPLGAYATQEVRNPLREGETSAVLAVGEAAIVRGTKCNNTETPVKVIGSFGWLSVEPGGRYVAVTERNANERAPGCTTQTFSNDMPDKVIDIVREFAAKGQTRTVWRITGTETPISDDDGSEGVARVWTSSNFTIDTTITAA